MTTVRSHNSQPVTPDHRIVWYNAKSEEIADVTESLASEPPPLEFELTKDISARDCPVRAESSVARRVKRPAGNADEPISKRIAMESTIMEYPRKTGTIVDNKGGTYERRLPALLALRLALFDEVKDFGIVSNINHVGDFDDIVIWVELKNDKFVFFLQLKHQYGKEQMELLTPKTFLEPKEIFYLKKHYESFQTFLDKEINSDIIKKLKSIQNRILIFYTNKTANVENCSFLKEISCKEESSELTELLKLLNSSSNSTGSTRYKFNCNNSSLKEDYETETDFLNKLHLFVNQINADNIEKLIKSEILVKLKLKSMETLDQAVKEFLEFISKWIDGYDIEGHKKHQVLTKKLVKNILVGRLLDPYKIHCTKTTSCEKKERTGQSIIWKELMNEKTITLIKKTDATSKFLLDFYENELQNKIKESPELWKTDLTDLKLTDIYYKFKPSKIAEVCQNSELNIPSIYKFLYTNGEVPLLLKLECKEHYEVITKILGMCQHDLKVIMLENFSMSLQTTNKDCFSSLQDLSTEKQAKILDYEIKFQGRADVSLKSLLNNEEHYRLIKCHDIIDILSGNYNIGNKCRALVENFINRRIPNILLNLDVLNSANDNFVIETDNIETAKKNLKDFITDACYIVSPTETLQKMKSLKGIVHRLVYNDPNLEWKESNGNISNLRNFRSLQPPDTPPLASKDVGQFLIDDVLVNKTRIISACSGAGKSDFLQFLALHAPSDLWVVYINVRELMFKNCKMNTHNIEYDDLKQRFDDNITKSLENDISKAIYKQKRVEKKLFFIFDAFNETPDLFQKKMMGIIKNLQTEHMVVIATQEHIQEDLEDALNVCALTLQPFKREEQKDSIVKYFKIKIDNPQHDSIIEKFVSQLLTSVKNNLQNNFMGIAMETKLLCEVYLEHCKDVCNNQHIAEDFEVEFDVQQLIGEYIKLKNDIMIKKYNGAENYWKDQMLQVQYFLALRNTFFENEFLLNHLNIDETLNSLHTFPSNQVLADGILTVKKNGDTFSFEFSHAIFSDYLAAEYLFQNFTVNKDICELTLTTLFFVTSFPLMLKVLHIMASKDCKLHLNIINGRFNEVIRTIQTSPSLLFKTNVLHQTAFHMLAIYGKQIIFEVIKFNQVKDCIDKLIGFTSPEDFIKNCIQEYYRTNNSGIYLFEDYIYPFSAGRNKKNYGKYRY